MECRVNEDGSPQFAFSEATEHGLEIILQGALDRIQDNQKDWQQLVGKTLVARIRGEADSTEQALNDFKLANMLEFCIWNAHQSGHWNMPKSSEDGQAFCVVQVWCEPAQQNLIDNESNVVDGADHIEPTDSRIMDSEFVDSLASKSQELRDATDALQLAAQQNESLEAPFERYTAAVKGVAATVLEERIKQSFADKIGDDGKSTESLDEKVEHARKVRAWLQEWDFSLYDIVRKKIYNFTAVAKGEGNHSAYRLTYYGDDGQRKFVDGWPTVKEVLCSPNLVSTSKISEKKIEKH